MAVTDTSIACFGTRAMVALAILWSPVVLAGEMHRWVDEGGEVHYTDAPPPESAQSTGSGEEQPKEDPGAQAREDAAAAERAERSRQDRVLWESYSTVAEIERTRDRRLEAVDGEIGLAEHRVQRARDRIEHYDRLLADLPEDNEHRDEMLRQRVAARERLERRRAELERAQGRRMRMEARFAREIERFRELVADRE